MTTALLYSHLQSLEEIPPMIAVVGSMLLKQIQDWPDVPAEWAHLAATCVVLADVMAWRCEELREALQIKPALSASRFLIR